MKRPLRPNSPKSDGSLADGGQARLNGRLSLRDFWRAVDPAHEPGNDPEGDQPSAPSNR